MADLPAAVPGLAELKATTRGHPAIVVAVIDGAADRDHPSLAGARLRHLPEDPIAPASSDDQTAVHGTHVTSIIFGQPGSEVEGVAPGCTGLLIPVFRRDRRRVPQLELARAIERAVDAGAHVINLSGGQYVDSGDAEDLLQRAVQACEDHDVLLVAAAGNDGCDCLHVPAALRTAVAVGALGDDGQPLPASNWGKEYAHNGVLAPGEDMLGAIPGGGTARLTGTSAAAPVVSGIAALLLSRQLALGERPDPHQVRQALLRGARPCPYPDAQSCQRLLGGIVDIEGALRIMSNQHDAHGSVEQACTCGRPAGAHSAAAQLLGAAVPSPLAQVMPDLAAPTQADEASGLAGASVAGPTTADASPAPEASAATPPSPPPLASQATPAMGAVQAGAPDPGLVYALGTIGYDFGTEARRDSFKQLMAPAVIGDQAVPANPHDTRQMVEHLERFPSEAQSLIWTLNLELTPLYALQAVGPFAQDVYGTLQELLTGEIQARTAEEFIERASIPGILSGRSVRLFSGQSVPVVEVAGTRGIYGWRSNWLITTAVEHVKEATGTKVDEAVVSAGLEGFLNRVYYDMRNLGVLSADRALNFAATNAFQAAAAFAEALTVGMQLDTILVEPSPYARADADAWDVKLKFFDPENLRRARRVYRFTVDVSELMPVTLGEVRSWSTSS